METFLGIDGGATRTRALLVTREGRVLGLGQSSGSNPNACGMEGALAALRDAVARAHAAAGLAPAPAAAAFLGLSGAGNPSTALNIQDSVTAAGLVSAGRCRVGNDLEAALAGALEGRPGIALVAGTGSLCLGRDASGALARCGGWGWIVDDVGGGAGLGRAALTAVFHAEDGRGPATALTGLMIAHALGAAKAGTGQDLVRWLYSNSSPGPSLAALAPLVTQAGSSGDSVALRLLREGAAGLAEMARQVSLRLSLGAAPELVLAGSLARSGPPYQPLLEETLRAAIPGLRIVDPSLPPVAGAALLALQGSGHAITPEVLKQLKAAAA